MLSAEFALDVFSRLALFDPDLLEFRSRALARRKELFVQIGVVGWIIVGKIVAVIDGHSDELRFIVIVPNPGDMELSASEFWVAFQPLFQDGIDIGFDQRAVRGQLTMEERDDHNSAFCHDTPFTSHVSPKFSSQ